MMRLSLCAVLLAALVAPSVEAQVRIPPPPPPDRRVAFSAREAPEILVYKIFFDEFAASQKAADDRRDKGEDDTKLRTLFQHKLGLTGHEQQMLVSAAQACVATLRDHQRARRQLMQEWRQSRDKTAAAARLTELRAASDAAVADGVQQLRLSLSPERFARLDLMIRVRVVQGLKITPGQPSAKTPSGGN